MDHFHSVGAGPQARAVNILEGKLVHYTHYTVVTHETFTRIHEIRMKIIGIFASERQQRRPNTAPPHRKTKDFFCVWNFDSENVQARLQLQMKRQLWQHC